MWERGGRQLQEVNIKTNERQYEKFFAVSTRKAVSKGKNRLKNTNAKLVEVLSSYFLLKKMRSLIGREL